MIPERGGGIRAQKPGFAPWIDGMQRNGSGPFSHFLLKLESVVAVWVLYEPL